MGFDSMGKPEFPEKNSLQAEKRRIHGFKSKLAPTSQE